MGINHKNRTFSRLYSVSPFGPFQRPKWEISLLFRILQQVKSLPFYVPEAWKRYPSRVEPPRISYFREYPPGCKWPYSSFQSLRKIPSIQDRLLNKLRTDFVPKYDIRSELHPNQFPLVVTARVQSNIIMSKRKHGFRLQVKFSCKKNELLTVKLCFLSSGQYALSWPSSVAPADTSCNLHNVVFPFTNSVPCWRS